MLKPENITDNDWKILQKIYGEKKEYLRQKLESNYPVQYLIGYVDFYGLILNVDERVFIPRFETELLVFKTIKYINDLNLVTPSIIDVCSGSGCIAITLAKNIANCCVDAIELSKEAILLAEENAKNNCVSVNFTNKDIFMIENLKNYDVIISNPPYVRRDEKIASECAYEPNMAFYANHEGLAFYEHILEIASKDTKLIAFEIGYQQGEAVVLLAKRFFPNYKICLEKDYAGKDRYVFIIKTA